jgi:hypothetical protein
MAWSACAVDTLLHATVAPLALPLIHLINFRDYLAIPTRHTSVTVRKGSQVQVVGLAASRMANVLLPGPAHALALPRNRFLTVTMSIGNPQDEHEWYMELGTAPTEITDKDV